MSVSPTSDLLQQGLVLHRQGAFAEAAMRYAGVLRADPGNADANYYLALISCQQGRFDEGAEFARKSLASDPRHARAHVVLGRALGALGQPNEALASFVRAIALAPELAEAHANRADVLRDIGRHAEAIESYDRALALTPDSFADWLHRGVACIAVGRYEDAIASLDRATALNPDFDQAHLLFAPRLLSMLRICDWTNLETNVAELLTMIRAQTPIGVPSAGFAIPASVADQLECARRYVKDQPAFPPIWRGEIYPHDRLRIAYLSADFNEHPMAHLTAGLYEHHDRSQFEVTAISFGRDDNSQIRRRLENGFEHYIDVQNRPDQEIADLVRRLEIDIAVDLMGFSKDNRLNVFARRAAPIQVNYLGYPATMGADYIDYILADATVIPEDQDIFYREQVVRLPDSYLINDNRRRIAEHTPTRTECGLPESAFVFCCFNNTQKLTPQFFDVWMRILRATENSVIWLLEENSKVPINLRREAEKRGVASDRLVFAPKINVADHLARQRQADLFLDTLPCNAHTTASDALWAGLPVLTCLGETLAGRVAASLLRAIGLGELVTHSLRAYEDLALQLAREPAYLASIKEKLARNRDTSPLFDTERSTRHIEAAYRTMADVWRRGDRPRGFSVERK
jgi:protein O-GlcNAc transferase